MKASLILLFFTVVPLPAYTFTNSEGKSFEGEILRVQKDTVIIERSADHRSFSIAFDKLTAADQAYATKWKKENPDIKLSFNVVKTSQNSTVKGSNQESDDSFKIEVKNANPEATPDLKLYYHLSKRISGDKEMLGFDVSKEKLSGNLDIESIPAFRTTTVNTPAVHVAKILSTTVTTNRDRSGQTSENVLTKKGQVVLKGIYFIVFYKNREVARWFTGGLQDEPVDLKAAGFYDKPGGGKR